MVRGQPRHVVGYLKEFLFDESQARAPVRSLSGGEKARLLLARIMAQPANLLVLDEPTNDLDVETLDLLQDLLGSFDGTVLLVSHDRDFIDRVATTTLVFEGQGRVTAYAGGWSDYLRAAHRHGGPRHGADGQDGARRARRQAGAQTGARPGLVLHRSAPAGQAAGRDRPAGGRDRQAVRAAGGCRAVHPRAREVPQGDRGPAARQTALARQRKNG